MHLDESPVVIKNNSIGFESQAIYAANNLFKLLPPTTKPSPRITNKHIGFKTLECQLTAKFWMLYHLRSNNNSRGFICLPWSKRPFVRLMAQREFFTACCRSEHCSTSKWRNGPSNHQSPFSCFHSELWSSKGIRRWNRPLQESESVSLLVFPSFDGFCCNCMFGRRPSQPSPGALPLICVHVNQLLAFLACHHHWLTSLGFLLFIPVHALEYLQITSWCGKP